MTRLEKAGELKEIEERLQIVRENIKALDSSYYKECTIRIFVNTEDFKYKGNREDLLVDNDMFYNYLKEEERRLENDSMELVEDLALQMGSERK